MSILRKLFTLYIATLLLLPCNDTAVCADEQASVTHTDTVEKDICTPFCICQCCRTAVEEINLFTWVAPADKPVDVWSVFVVQITKAPAHNIWQPPKLA